jgi:hypothetical protein
MKFVKMLTAVAFIVAVSASLALAADKEKELKGKIKEGSCCAKAKAAGKACAHPCCVEAAKAGNVCEKCNAEKKK